MKIKIIKVPGFQINGILPPFGMVKIYTYLKEKGFDIVQEDLDAMLHPAGDMNIRSASRDRLSRIFIQKKRLIDYFTTGQDRELEDITSFYVKNTDFEGVDFLLLSVFPFDLCSSMLALLMARYFKSEFNNKPVAIGGEIVQAAYINEGFSLYSELGLVDYYVSGFGERPLEIILKKMRGENVDLESAEGLKYKNRSRLTRLADKKSRFIHRLKQFFSVRLLDKIYIPIKLCSQTSRSRLLAAGWDRIMKRTRAERILLTPDFSGLSLERYEWSPGDFLKTLNGNSALPQARVLTLPYQIVSGCPNRCAFCARSVYKNINFLRPQEAVDNLFFLSRKYNTRHFFFLNTYLNITPWFVEEFCNEVNKRGLVVFWSDSASLKNINNPDMLVKMRRAGGCRLIFGLESASPRMQLYINKKIDLRKASNVLRWSHEAGIWTGLDIIAGMPHERQEDIDNTLNFLNANTEYIDEVWLTRFRLDMHSMMFHYPERYAISDIREADYPFQELIDNDLESYRYAFNETGGLKWQEKKKQIEESFQTIKRWALANRRLAFPIPSQLSLILYLYEYLSDKNEIRNYYRLYCEWFYSMHSASYAPSAI